MPVNEVVANQTEQKYKHPGILACTGGFLAGGITKGIVGVPTQIINPKLMNRLKDLSVLPEDQFAQVGQAVEKTLTKTGLDKKGVSILKATSENAERVAKLMADEMPKFIPQNMREFLGGIIGSMAAAGKSAMYTFKAKTLIMPEKDLILTTFHELGHAANANLSTVGKLLQKCRPLAILSTPIALIGLLKTKKAPGEKPKNAVDKATTFIHDNAGSLTFLSFVPMLAEEGMASIKGFKFAKAAGLGQELLAKTAKSYKLAYLTYLGMAASASLGIFLGIKVKDAIAKPKPIKQEA